LEVARELHLPLILLGQPTPKAYPNEKTNETLLPKNVWKFEVLRTIQQTWAGSHPDEVAFVDLNALLCPGNVCPEKVADGIVLRSDGLHFNPASAKAIGPAMAIAITDAFIRLWTGPARFASGPNS